MLNEVNFKIRIHYSCDRNHRELVPPHRQMDSNSLQAGEWRLKVAVKALTLPSRNDRAFKREMPASV